MASTGTFPTFLLELGLGSLPGTEYGVFDDPIRGKFDTAVFAPATLWTTIGNVFTAHAERGSQRLAGRYVTGSGQFLVDDKLGYLRPWNLSGLYVAAGVTQLQPDIRVRMRGVLNGASYTMWQGYVDSFLPIVKRVGGQCLIKASGVFKVLARYDPPAASAAVGGSEAGGTRVGRLLDLTAVPSTDRDLDAGNSTMQATTLAQNILAEAYLTADSELAALYETEDGKVAYDRRHAIFEESRSNSVQATFSDAAGQMHYADLALPEYDSTLVKNLIDAATVGGTAQRVTDATSAGKYWTRTYSRHDLILESDAEAANWAADTLWRNKDAEQRIDGVMFDWPSPDTVSVHRLSRQLRDRIRVVQTPSAGDALDKQLYIEGIVHDIAELDWKTRFNTSSATFSTNVGVFDSATLGKFDTAVFAAW